MHVTKVVRSKYSFSYYYLQQTKLWEAHVFSCGCHLVGGGGPYVTNPNDAL